MAECKGGSCPLKKGSSMPSKKSSSKSSKSSSSKSSKSSKSSSSKKAPAKKTDVFSRTGRAIKNLFTGTKEALVGKSAETKRFPKFTKNTEAAINQLRSMGLENLKGLKPVDIQNLLSGIQQQNVNAPFNRLPEDMQLQDVLGPLRNVKIGRGELNPIKAFGNQLGQATPEAALNQYAQLLSGSNVGAPLQAFAKNMGPDPLEALKGLQGKLPPEITQQLMQEQVNMLSGGAEGAYKRFDPIAELSRRQFFEDIVPQLSQQFEGAGALRSSNFRGALGAAGGRLQSELAAMRAQYGLQQQGESRQLLDALQGRQLQRNELQQGLAGKLAQFGLEERGQRQNLATAQSELGLRKLGLQSDVAARQAQAQLEKLGLSRDQARMLSEGMLKQNDQRLNKTGALTTGALNQQQMKLAQQQQRQNLAQNQAGLRLKQNALNQSLGLQGAQLGVQQQGQLQNQAFNQLQLGLQPKFDTGFNPSQPGLLQGLAGGVGQAAGSALPLLLAGLS